MRPRRRMVGSQADAGHQRIATGGLTAKPQRINSRCVRNVECDLSGPGPVALHERRAGYDFSILVLNDTFDTTETNRRNRLHAQRMVRIEPSFRKKFTPGFEHYR